MELDLSKDLSLGWQVVILVLIAITCQAFYGLIF